MWKPNLTFLPEYSDTIDRLIEKKELLDASRPLPTSALIRIKEALSIEWTYNSNAIEGNTLSLQETHVILNDGMTIGGKSMREHFEAHNHDKAIKYVSELVERGSAFSSIAILDIHELVLSNIEDHYAGRIRNGGVRINGANFTPPNALKVPELLDELIDYILHNPDHLDIMSLAAVFHHRFVWIHPFFDGNGRTARLSMNLLLMKSGFPPAIILKNDRKKYYAALNKANKGDYSKIALMMYQAVERSLNIYLDILPHDEDSDYQPISTIVSEPDVPYGQEYISLLARQGKIDAHKEGRNWVTTRKAVRDYMVSKETTTV